MSSHRATTPNLQAPLINNNNMAAAAAHQDPFYAAKEELKGKVDYIQARHEKFLTLLKASNTAVNTTFKDLRESLYRDVEAAENQTRELEKTVALVEGNRQRFRHIDNTELTERRAFLTRSKQTLVKIYNNLESDYVKNKVAADERDYQRSRQYGGGGGMDSRRTGAESENAAFIDMQRSRQHMMLREQDQGLEELGTAVDRVGRMADAMNQELNSQNMMLSDLEVEVENTNEKMNFVMGKLSKLLKTKDKCSLYTIIILSIILVVLFFMVVYV